VLAAPAASHAATLLLLAAGCAVVAASAAAGIALAHGDWASGATAGGLASLALAGICLVGTAVRAIGGQRRWHSVSLGLVVVVLFGTAGAAGLRAPAALHLAQARASEAHQDWNGAAEEYLLAGARAPGSADLARVYVEWGDALVRQGNYAPAVRSYFTTLYSFANAPDLQRRAINGLWQAYGAWLADSSSASAYSAIIHDIHAGGQASWCFGPCQASAALLEAQARFQYGVRLDRQQQYNLAIAFFESVAPTAPHSPYVTGAHLAAASDYFAIAQLYLSGKTCAQALGTYQRLASAYGDTAQGARARAALAQPAQVTGRVTGFPSNPAPAVYLSTHVASTTNFSDDYSASLDGAGHFTFNQVRPGRYNLSAAFADGSGRYWQSATTGDPYFVVVGPLCAQDLGQFPW
jgi:hypothetical protein